MGLVSTPYAMSSLLPPPCTPHIHACTPNTPQMLPHVGISCHWVSLTGNQSALQLHGRIQRLSTGKGIISVEPCQTDFLFLDPSVYQCAVCQLLTQPLYVTLGIVSEPEMVSYAGGYAQFICKCHPLGVESLNIQQHGFGIPKVS